LWAIRNSPAFNVADDPGFWQRAERFDHRVLENIFSIDSGARHARAVTMEFGPKLA